MKRYLLFFFFHMLCSACYSQKLQLTDTSYRSWSYLEPGYTKLSRDGKFIFYQINSIDSKNAVIGATDNSWQMKFRSVVNCNFTLDGKQIFVLTEDSLKYIAIPFRKCVLVTLCSNYKYYIQGTKEWILYMPKNNPNTLVVWNIQTNKTKLYYDVGSYDLNPNASAAILKTRNSDGQERLRWLDLQTGVEREIYNGPTLLNVIFDNSGRQIAFMNIVKGQTTIWHYETPQITALPIVCDTSLGMLSGHRIATGVWRFSSDSKNLFFAQQATKKQTDFENPDLKVWSYEDAISRSLYRGASAVDRNLTIYNIKERKLRVLLTGIKKLKNVRSLNTDVMLVEATYGSSDEIFFNSYSRPSYYVLFTKTGELLPIKKNSKVQIDAMELSEDGHFLLYFDPEEDKYVSYDLQKREARPIMGIDEDLHLYDAYRRNAKGNSRIAGILAWTGNKNHVLIQARYNIWAVDVSGKMAPVNLTKTGKSDSMIFTLLNKPPSKLLKSESLFITGYRLADKASGLYRLNLVKTTFNEVYISRNAPARYYDHFGAFYPTENGCLIAEQSAASPLNYKFTKDFKSFVNLTDNHPEKEYHWLTATLLNYRDKNSAPCEGILYRLEKLDTTQKHPIILTFYQDESERLNDFLSPEPRSSGINIPLLVSRGYIVFVPNTYQIMGAPGESALTSVVAAVDHLATYKWADTSRMAIAGISWGGYETNYIATHSSCFKAVYSAAGVSNLVSAYNEFAAGFSWQRPVREGYYAMVEGLDKRPEQYVNNSPIFFAKNVTSPILLMHNDNDESVPVTHSLQLFNQLRSLRKPVWLLQYKGEPHGVDKLANRLDLQNKVQGFFDHYLKGMPKPDWMITHIGPEYE